MSMVLKVVGNTWQNASRDKRELSVYKEMGNEVLVLAKGEPSDRGRIEDVDGFKVIRYTTRPLSKHFPDSLNRFVSLFVWAQVVRNIRPEVISGHDLLPGLLVSWMSTWFQKKKPKLIYDSHEFELGRNTDKKRSKATQFAIAHLEKKLMNKCAFSIMVNDSIADEVQKIYKLKKRPIVIRSIPDYWDIDPQKCNEKRKEFRETFKSRGEDLNFLVMYHGSVVRNRGIEVLIRLLACNPEIQGVVLGNGGHAYLEELHEMAREKGVESRLIFHEAVPLSELWKYVGAADVSLMMISGESRSYYLSLPNKFFESIQSETPIIASDFPEMRNLINQYEIGLTCNPDKIEEVNRCIEALRSDPNRYKLLKKNISKAKHELCWEREKIRLKNAVQMYIGNEGL